MTATPITSTASGKKRKKPLPSWRTWIVPTVFLRDFIWHRKHIWQYRYMPPQNQGPWHGIYYTAEDSGWRIHLALEISTTIGQNVDATARNLHRVMSGESNCIHAEFAEATVMSVGLDMDRDTNIPVLPGNMNKARELLEVRDPHFRERPKAEQLHFQREVMELCVEIIQHPERLEQLQDVAPFNCLRPPLQ